MPEIDRTHEFGCRWQQRNKLREFLVKSQLHYINIDRNDHEMLENVLFHQIQKQLMRNPLFFTLISVFIKGH